MSTCDHCGKGIQGEAFGDDDGYEVTCVICHDYVLPNCDFNEKIITEADLGDLDLDSYDSFEDFVRN